MGFFKSTLYSPVRQVERYVEEQHSEGETRDTLSTNNRRHFLGHDGKINQLLIGLLVISMLFNGIAYVAIRGTQGRLQVDIQSYVGLQRNVATEIVHDTADIDDPGWDDPLYDHNVGWIALSTAFAEAQGLPTSMRWPWDSEKGIYILQGFHTMHCVYAVRRSLNEFRKNLDQTFSYVHIDHCLITLREDTLCSADDTPRYTGHLHAQANMTVANSGIGQFRMCRDWNKLRDFALDHSACHHRPEDHYVPLIDQYKSCPDGSKPWEIQD